MEEVLVICEGGWAVQGPAPDGYAVERVLSVGEGLQRMTERCPSWVVLDLGFGLDSLLALKQAYPSVPVIALAGADVGEALAALQAGASHALDRGWEELPQKIEAFVMEQRQHRQRWQAISKCCTELETEFIHRQQPD